MQIRWETTKKPPSDLDSRAERYLSGLQGSARRRKQTLTYSHSANREGVTFKWHGPSKGVGRICWEPASQRVFILERSADRKESVVAEANRIFDSFQGHVDPIPWSVLDFDVRLPVDLLLEKFKFLTGRITFQFKGKGMDLTAERWGLADSILAKHDLADWASALVGADVVEHPGKRLRLVRESKLPMGRSIEALVRHDEELNRLVLLKALHRRRPPRWDWLP